MKLKVALIIIVILLWASSLTILALDANRLPEFYISKKWSTRDGLPLNSIIAITQTPDGYLWLGTRGGVCRFDGLDIEIYTHENVSQLANDNIICLFVDSNGTLWISQDKGGITFYRNRHFYRPDQLKPLENSTILSIHESPSGAIWLGTDNGLFKLFQ